MIKCPMCSNEMRSHYGRSKEMAFECVNANCEYDTAADAEYGHGLGRVVAKLQEDNTKLSDTLASLRDDAISPLFVAKLELRPGDVLVVKLNVKFQDEAHIERVRANWERLALPNVRILLLDETVDVSILRKEEIEERAV